MKTKNLNRRAARVNVPLAVATNSGLVSDHKQAQCTVEIRSHVAFKSRNFLFRQIYIGNTIEMTWPSVRSSVVECISIANTNFEKIGVTIDPTCIQGDLNARKQPHAF